MGRVLARQLLIAGPLTLFGAATLVFFIVQLTPGDPVVALLGEFYNEVTYNATRARLGLDKPLLSQYVGFLKGIVTLDLGNSFGNERPVFANVIEQLPYTLHLALASMFLATLFALPAGILAAIRRNSVVDYSLMIVALLGISAPVFVGGIVLILLFSVRLGWAPSYGVGEVGNLGSILAHLALPAIAQGMNSAALLARVMRSSLLSVLPSDFLRTARAKGIGSWKATLKHAVPNALIPVVTIAGLNFSTLMGGAVVIETVFSRQGLGRLLIGAVRSRDFPQVQACVIVIVAVVVMVNVVVDLMYGLMNPKIRYA